MSYPWEIEISHHELYLILKKKVVFGAGDLLKRFKPLCQATGKWKWFVMLKHPFGGKVPRGSAKVIWGTISVCSHEHFKDRHKLHINHMLCTD